MKKMRIFTAILLIVAMFAFAGCSKDDNADGNVGTGNTTGSGVIDDAGDALEDAADNMGNSVDNMTDDNNANDNNSTGAAVNN